MNIFSSILRVGVLFLIGISAKAQVQETPPPNEPPIPIVFVQQTKDTVQAIEERLHRQETALETLSCRIDTLSARILVMEDNEKIPVILVAFFIVLLVLFALFLIVLTAWRRKLFRELEHFHSLLSAHTMRLASLEEEYQRLKAAGGTQEPHASPRRRQTREKPTGTKSKNS